MSEPNPQAPGAQKRIVSASSQVLNDDIAEPSHDLAKNEASAKDEFCISGYHVIKQIGHGAQGKVYQAVRHSDGQMVAIKRLNIDSVKSWKSYELFHREADVLASLNIPGVARFYEAIDRLEDNPLRRISMNIQAVDKSRFHRKS